VLSNPLVVNDPLALADPLAVSDALVLAGPLAVSDALVLTDPLVVGDELVVGETLLVHRGALTLQLRLGSLPTRLLLGDPSSPLGSLGALCPGVGFLPMLRGGLIATLLELALAGTSTAALTATRHNESKGDHYQHYDNDDRDYYTS
jgi:hypothetical protein